MEIYAHEPSGYEGFLVRVEVDMRRGIPGMDLVGLAAAAVRESRERVRAAMRNSGFLFPQDRLLINLAPADLPKRGAAYDLPIAIKILSTASLVPDCGRAVLALGELTLDGSVRPVRGVLPAVQAALKAGIRIFLVAEENRAEAEASGKGAVYPISRLEELAQIMAMIRDGRKAIPSMEPGMKRQAGPVDEMDFSDFRGGEELLRALAVAAAGRHNILLFGPVGGGKTMAAMRFPSILPDLSEQEAIALSSIKSLAGLIAPGEAVSFRPPFRAPHHSATLEGMVGGGQPIHPGEISLSHKGVLFLDETPEFKRDVLQSLREPMEQGQIAIVRAGRAARYPSDFQLFLAANSCPCGNAGRPGKTCVCSDNEIQHYWRRLGGPLLDRVDMRIPVFPPGPDALMREPSFSLEDTKRSVRDAVTLQFKRSASSGGYLNAKIPPGAITSLCRLDTKARRVLDAAVVEGKLSARACHSVLKVARTIGDMKKAETIDEEAMLLAIVYRQSGPGGGVWPSP
ncbi:MAG: YifB family Mg chelatase-like AAA ATPase [Rectinema sp.]